MSDDDKVAADLLRDHGFDEQARRLEVFNESIEYFPPVQDVEAINRAAAVPHVLVSADDRRFKIVTWNTRVQPGNFPRIECELIPEIRDS